MTGQQQPDPAHSTVEQLNHALSIPEQAAEWLLRWHAGDLAMDERYKFLHWLKESPVHTAEFLRMVRLHAWLRKAFGTERDNLDRAWKAIRGASNRDLVLWTEDSVPPAPRIAQAVGLVLPIPDSTLKIMASYERERRSKRKERAWWVLGIVLTVVFAPIVLKSIEKLIAASSSH